MVASFSDRVLAGIDEASGLYHRLVLVVGPPRNGKTHALHGVAAARGWPIINVNLQLSKLLLDLTQKQRVLRTHRLLDDIVKASLGNVVLLDNIELLFGLELAQDPLRLLQGLARDRAVVASWCGEFDGSTLTYAEPGHPEARRYSRPEAVIVVEQASWPQNDRGSLVAPKGFKETT